MGLVKCASLATCVALVTIASASAADRRGPPPPIGADSAGMFYITYPKDALRRGEQGTVAYRTTVDKDGEAVDCAVTKSSGSKQLDTLTCQAVIYHAKFKRAVDEKGFPILARYDGKVVWSIR